MKARILPFLAALALTGAAFAQSTAFTYQGRLTNGGSPASGLHDFRFKLFDAPAGGSQVGTTLCANNIIVADGLFATTLDFGQQFATPAGRFLEIQVRADTGIDCASNSGLVTLSPRQPLTAAPLATHAKAAFALDAADGGPANAVVVDNSGNVGIGTAAPLTRLDVRGPLSVGSFGDQADLLWLNTERDWVFRQEGSGASTALKLQSVGGGGNKNFLFQTDGAVGIRSTAGADLWLAGGQEALRIVRGSIRADGAVLAGTGFTVNHLGTGDYFISFATPFASTPTVTASSEYTSAFAPSVAKPDALIPASAHVVIKDAADGFLADRDFHFIAVGPR